ncbi:MAG: ATP-binding protein [bacterium]
MPAARVNTTQTLHNDESSSRYFWRDGRLRTYSRRCAIAVAIIASGVLLGWYARIPGLVLINEHFVAVQFNTALGFLLVSGALFALTARRNRIAMALSLIALVVSGTTLGEYFSKKSFGIDDLVWALGVSRAAMGHLASAGHSMTGRIPFNAALSLTLLAVALTTVATGRMTYVRLMFACVPAIASATMGAVALAGYLFAFPNATMWGNYALMAPQSAAMFLVIGSGVVSGSILTARRAGLHLGRVVPGLAMTTVAVAAVLSWEALLDHDVRNLATAVRHQANAVAGAISRSVDDRARIVDRLSQGNSVAGGDSPAARSLSSSQIIRDYPGITAISWLDSAGTVVWRMAEHSSPTEDVGARFATTPFRDSLLLQARGRDRGIVSSAVPSGADAQSVFIVAATSASNRTASGYFVVELVPERLLADVLPAEFTQLYGYVLEDGDVTLARHATDDGTSTSRWATNVTINVRGRQWRLTVAPTRRTVREFSSSLPTIFLILALACALFTGWIVRTVQIAAEQSRRLARTVADLAAENDARRLAEKLLDEHTDMLQVQAHELEIQYEELQVTATKLVGQRDELSRAQEFSAALVRSTVDAVAAFNVDGRVHAWNPAMSMLTGRARGEAGQAMVGTLLPFLAEGEEVRLLQEALAGRATTMHALKASHEHSRTDVSLDLTVTPMTAADGTVVGGLLVARDVTEQQRVAELIIASKEAAEASNRAKSDFLARMSHELRTPLNAVIGFTNVIRRNTDNHLRKTDLTYLDRIGANGKHLLALIDTVLDISKIESGRETVELSMTPISALVRDTVAELDVRATEAGLHVHVATPWGAQATTDQAKLKQVLINLVGNAIKFTPRDGRIFVRVETDPFTGVATRIDVEDSGIGIPADRLDAIFEAFEQADPQIAHTYGGTGLGLSISQKLCMLMGHELVVASQPGKGSKFSILLRAQPATAAA